MIQCSVDYATEKWKMTSTSNEKQEQIGIIEQLHLIKPMDICLRATTTVTMGLHINILRFLVSWYYVEYRCQIPLISKSNTLAVNSCTPQITSQSSPFTDINILFIYAESKGQHSVRPSHHISVYDLRV